MLDRVLTDLGMVGLASKEPSTGLSPFYEVVFLKPGKALGLKARTDLSHIMNCRENRRKLDSKWHLEKWRQTL